MQKCGDSVFEAVWVVHGKKIYWRNKEKSKNRNLSKKM